MNESELAKVVFYALPIVHPLLKINKPPCFQPLLLEEIPVKTDDNKVDHLSWIWNANFTACVSHKQIRDAEQMEQHQQLSTHFQIWIIPKRSIPSGEGVKASLLQSQQMSPAMDIHLSTCIVESGGPQIQGQTECDSFD
jgi:hypothetical protein